MKIEAHCTTTEAVKNAVQMYLKAGARRVAVEPCSYSNKGWDVTVWPDERPEPRVDDLAGQEIAYREASLYDHEQSKKRVAT